tara:strand:- start:2297 stop:2938 length:642 start_codon:yes stop_codon:yes gene_type:complete
MNFPLSTSILWPAEKFINHLIESDSHVEKQFSNLAGKSLEINTSSPSMRLIVQFDCREIRLIEADENQLEAQADLKVSGHCDQLLKILSNRGKGPSFNPKINLAGDAILAQELQEALSTIDIDWPRSLAPWLGHIAANEVAKNGRKAIDWTNRFRESVNRNLHDYMKEETELFPQIRKLDRFKHDLDLLKLRVDRVMARVQRLSQKIESRTEE